MNSRERVLTALNHEEPDRPAIDFSGHRSSGISAIAYARLKEALGIDSGDVYVYDMVQQLAIVEEPVLRRFNVDCVEMGRGFWAPMRALMQETMVDLGLISAADLDVVKLTDDVGEAVDWIDRIRVPRSAYP